MSTYLNPDAIQSKSITADKLADDVLGAVSGDLTSIQTQIDANAAQIETNKTDISSIKNNYLKLTGGTLTGIINTKDIRANFTSEEEYINIGTPSSPFNYLFCQNIGNINQGPNIYTQSIKTTTHDTYNIGELNKSYHNIYATSFVNTNSSNNYMLLGGGLTKSLDINTGVSVYAGSMLATTTTDPTWIKIAEWSADDVPLTNNAMIMLLYCSAERTVAHELIAGMLGINIRRSSATTEAPYNYSCYLFNIAGNMTSDRMRLYYDKTNGGVSLWYKHIWQYGGMNFKVIYSTTLISTQQALGTWMSTNLRTEEERQTLPDTDYVEVKQFPQPANITGDLTVNGRINATSEITSYYTV